MNFIDPHVGKFKHCDNGEKQTVLSSLDQNMKATTTEFDLNCVVQDVCAWAPDTYIAKVFCLFISFNQYDQEQ